MNITDNMAKRTYSLAVSKTEDLYSGKTVQETKIINMKQRSIRAENQRRTNRHLQLIGAL